MIKPKKQYLGDGVYVKIDEIGMLILTTEDGVEVTNTIYLEPEVTVELVKFIEGLVNE